MSDALARSRPVPRERRRRHRRARRRRARVSGRSPCRLATASSRSASRTAGSRPPASTAGAGSAKAPSATTSSTRRSASRPSPICSASRSWPASARDGRDARDQPAAGRRPRLGRLRGRRRRHALRSRRPRRPHPAGGRSPVKDPTFWMLARASGLLAYAALTAVDAARPARQGAAVPLALTRHRHRPPSLRRADRTRRARGPRHRARARCGDADAGAGPRHTRALAVPPGLDVGRSHRRRADDPHHRLVPAAPLSSAPRRWRRLHWATYATFALAAIHGIASGTDTSRPWVMAFYAGTIGAVAAATVWRALVPPPRRVPRRPRLPRASPNQPLEGALPMSTYRIVIDRALCSGFGACADARARADRDRPLGPRHAAHRRDGRREHPRRRRLPARWAQSPSTLADSGEQAA